MASTYLGFVGVLLALVCAFIYKRHLDNVEHEKLKTVLSGLITAEEQASLSSVRIAVGFGGCRDIIVNASDLFDKLNVTLPENPYHVKTVSSKEDLENLFAYFFRHGAATERYVSDKKLFQEVRKALSEIPAELKREYVAGAAPTMAKHLANAGAEILLGARITEATRQELPTNIMVVGGKIEKDDLHVIMEYKVNDVMGPYTAPRDNRAIIHSDSSSPYLDSLEEFAERIESFKPSLVILAGLQMMDNFPFLKDERVRRLTKLRALLQSLPVSTKVHFEVASFADEDLVHDLIEYVLPHVDSMGMNEQELPNIVAVITGGNVTFVSDAKPRIATVLDGMRTLYSAVSRARVGRRRFTRVHVHTLAYQAILTDATSDWRSTMSAVARASLTAHRYTCGVDQVDARRAKLIMDESFRTSAHGDEGTRVQFDGSHPVSCWREDHLEICVAPVLVCTKVCRTAGAGDNISSSSIVVQI